MKKFLYIIGICLLGALVWFWVLPRFNLNSDSQIPNNWKKYSNNTAGFSLKYDPTLTVKEDLQTSIRFYKWGPTQRGQTEIYDGIIFSVQRVDLQKGIEEHINSRMSQFKNVGTITDPLHDSRVNGALVKEFSASSLGDFTLVFVPIDSRTLLEISYMTPDPTNAGFRKVVELMLSSFSLIK